MNTEQTAKDREDWQRKQEVREQIAKAQMDRALKRMARQQERTRKSHAKEQEQARTDGERHVREAFLPVLEWFAENGSQDQQDAARAALADWGANRQIWEQWGQESGYIGLVQRACANFDAFRAGSRKTDLPSEEAERVRGWVFSAATMINRRKGFSGKKMAPQRRKIRKSS